MKVRIKSNASQLFLTSRLRFEGNLNYLLTNPLHPSPLFKGPGVWFSKVTSHWFLKFCIMNPFFQDKKRYLLKSMVDNQNDEGNGKLGWRIAKTMMN
jgi:hypothetical protein